MISFSSSSCSKQKSVIQQLLSRKGRLIIMCSQGDISAVGSSASCRVIQVPEVADCLQPVINIIPLQVWCQSYPKTSVALCAMYLDFIYRGASFPFLDSVARIPPYCSPWIRCRPAKKPGQERDYTVSIPHARARARAHTHKVNEIIIFREK